MNMDLDTGTPTSRGTDNLKDIFKITKSVASVKLLKNKIKRSFV
jgi:hypothetical protein